MTAAEPELIVAPITANAALSQDSPLAQEWDALFATALPHQLFQARDILRHWSAHYLDRDDLPILLAGRRAGKLVMLWPLVLQRRLGLTTLRFMGLPIAQFCDVLLAPDEEPGPLLAAGWQAVGELGADLFALDRLRADAALLRASLPHGAIRHDSHAAPYAELATRVGPDGPSQAYPPRERSNHRRRLRRLAEHGEIGFAELRPGPEAAALAAACIAMKRLGLQRHGIVAPTISDPRFSAFFAALAADPAAPLRLSVIRRNDIAIAIDLAFDSKGVSFGHVLATHPDHERGGVGRILVHHSFANALARGNARFDLMPPADDYKREHADGFTAVTDFTLPLSARGRLFCALKPWRMRPAAKALLRRLPAPLAQRLAAWTNRREGV